MSDVKNIVLKPITSKEANAFVKRVHYSGKVVQNSSLHIGVYYMGKLEGVMQFGSPLDKRKMLPLVSGTEWHQMLELNRMAFTETLPRNSESRAIAIAMKLIAKHAPQVKWVLSFADATQCGDGAIYRASGFVLTSIKQNGQLYRLPHPSELDIALCKMNGLSDSEINAIHSWLQEITPLNSQLVMAHKLTIEDRPNPAPSCDKMALEGAPHAHKMSIEGGVRPSALLSQVKNIMRRLTNGGTSADKLFRAIGGYPAKGYQLRYIYFIDKSYQDRLTCPIVPFSKIKEMGVGMYRGEKIT